MHISNTKSMITSFQLKLELKHQMGLGQEQCVHDQLRFTPENCYQKVVM